MEYGKTNFELKTTSICKFYGPIGIPIAHKRSVRALNTANEVVRMLITQILYSFLLSANALQLVMHREYLFKCLLKLAVYFL